MNNKEKKKQKKPNFSQFLSIFFQFSNQKKIKKISKKKKILFQTINQSIQSFFILQKKTIKKPIIYKQLQK
jgi:hypothetical protein